ncbi:hypothetical protein KW803_01965 [Candidatus Saccharibacteria bacterium]|nr:hypothetical protein [Candidatus Saccharibacteria bacterium]
MIHAGNALVYDVRWDVGPPPEHNDELRGELDERDDCLVYPTYGRTSLVVDLDLHADIGDILAAFQTHGYAIDVLAEPVC